MTIDFGAPANLNIGGTTYMSIDAAGRVSLPFHPVCAGQNGNGPAQGADVIFGTMLVNIGNCYNTANGRFTAPIAGKYFFRYHQLAPNANAGEYRTALYLNGAAYGGLRFIMVKPANTWWSLIAEGHIAMAVNDYVTVRFESGAANLYTDGNYNSFSAHLVG
jgi:hypothetical protein